MKGVVLFFFLDVAKMYEKWWNIEAGEKQKTKYTCKKAKELATMKLNWLGVKGGKEKRAEKAEQQQQKRLHSPIRTSPGELDYAISHRKQRACDDEIEGLT